MAQEEVVLDEFINSDVRCVGSIAEIGVSWTATSTFSGNADYYILRKAEGESDFMEAGMVTSNIKDISYTDKNEVESDKIYVYRVKVDYKGDIFYSNNATTTKKAYCPPVLLPSSTSCHSDGPYVDLAWSPVSGSLLKYELYRKAPGEIEFSFLATTIETFYADGPDIIGTESYYYYVKSVWQDGASVFYILDQDKKVIIPACEPILFTSTDCLNSTAPGGPIINLSWNKLLGIQKYQIYRQAPGEADFSPLAEITDEAVISFDDQLAASLPNAYYNNGDINYMVQAVWETAQRNSNITQINIPRCKPFLSITNNCDSFSFKLKWTATQGNYLIYNIYRDGVWQYRNDGISNIFYEDGLDEGICPGEVCAFNYRIEAIANVVDVLSSDIVEASINCTAVVAPSPAPILNEPTISCSLGKSQVYLSWSASDNVTYYTVYRTSEGVTSELITSGTEYADTGVEVPYEYTYWVRAFGKGGYIDGPNAYAVTAIDCGAPAAPELSLGAECDGEGPLVELSWAETSNTYTYSIYKGLSADSLNLLTVLSKDITNFSDDVVSPLIQYYYKVVANGPPVAEGEDPIQSESEIKSIATLSCFPAVPGLTVSKVCDLGSPTINLDWTTNELNTFSYEIFRKDFSETAPIAAISNTADKHWSDDSIVLNSTYEYKVEAIGYESTIRSTEGYKSILASCPPTTPSLSLSRACVSGSPIVDLDWATDEANTIRYEIFRKDSSETTPIYIINDTSIKDWQDNSVAILTAYEYKIEAVGYSGERSTQGYKSITSYDCSFPGDFTLSDIFYCQGSYPRVDLSWTDSSNADSYDISRNLLNPDNSTAETTTFDNKTSVYTDWGLGNTLSFDGSNDYINIPYDISINPTSAITVEAWVKSANSSGYSAAWQIISKYSAYILGTDSSGGKNMCFIIYDTGWQYGSCYSVPDPQNWHHFVGTYDSIAKVKKIYVDGILRSTTNPSGSIKADTGPIHIGHSEGSSIGSNHFKGAVDEVRIYGRALTAAEVQEHYQGIFNNENNLAGLWHFDEGAGNSASDSSNAGNNGTISGATWAQNGLQYAERYNWQVDAIGIGGETSNLTDPFELPYCPPIKPGLVLERACSFGLSTVELLWSYSYGAESFEIHRKSADNPIGAVTLSDPRDWTDDNAGAGLVYSKKYTYTVKSIGPGGQTDSDSLEITTYDCSPPTQPQNLTANFSCSGSYPRNVLSWEESDHTTYYAVYRNGSFLTNITSTGYTDTNMSVNTAYVYTVRAFGPGGESELSASAEIASGYCAPSTLSNISLVTACESGSPINTLSWTDATSFNTDHYNVYRNGATVDDLIGTVSQGALSYIDSDSSIAILTDYIYYIKAIGPTGLEGALSSGNNITTYSCGVQPAVPILNLDNLYCQDNIPYAGLSWAGADNAYSYNLYRDNPDASQSVYSTAVSALTDKGDYALNFDGSNDYINIPSAVSLNPQKITMEAWVYPTGYSSSGNIIKKRYTEQYILRFYGTTGQIQGYVYVNGGWRYCTTNTAVKAGLNQWSHIVSTYDGNKIKVYVNGVQGCSFSYTGNINSGNSDLWLGAYSATAELFKGMIDEVRIYGRALSLTEIQDHYNNIYNNETELRGVWHFNEASGDTVFDSSGNGNNGRLGSSAGADSNDPIWKIPFYKTGYTARLYSNSTYEYKIKAMGVDEESEFSDSVQINTPVCLNPPVFGLYDRCTDHHNPVTVLYWQNQKNITEYQIYKEEALFENKIPTDYISEDGYIKHWLLIGPYENNYDSASGVWAGYYMDYIDEENVIPRAGETVEGNTWSDYYSTSDKIDFFNIFSPNTNRVAYAFSYIYSPIDQAAQLWIGSDDGVKAFLNGVKIHDNPGHRGIIADQDKISINLIAGINTLLIKVDQGTGDWALYARIVNVSGDNILDHITAWDSGAISGESANYYVKAKILDEESAASDVWSSNPLGCQPAQPNLNIAAQCESGISKLMLSWDSDPNGLTQYYTVHKRRISDSSWDLDPSFPLTLNKTETAYSDSNVTSDIDYQYYLEAVGKGVSVYSDAVSEKAIICYPPPSSSAIEVMPKCLGDFPRMEINWEFTENTIAYNIWRKNNTEADVDYTAIKSGLSPDSISYSDRTGLIANNVYDYKVEFVGAGTDNSVFSESSGNKTAIDCANIAPLAPILVVSSVDAYGNYAYASLAWIDSGNENKYIVLRDGVEIAVLAQESYYSDEALIIYYGDNTVSDYTDYSYQIAAVNNIGTTTSNIEIASIPIARPGEFTLSADFIKDEDTIVLFWTEPASTAAGGLISYKILRDDTKDFIGAEIVCEGITESPFECEDNNPDILKRFYKVEATNLGGTTKSNVFDTIAILFPVWKEVK